MTMIEDTPQALREAQPTGKPMISGRQGAGPSRSRCSSSSSCRSWPLLAAVPVAWGWGIGWTDLALAIAFYLVSLARA